MSIEKRYLACLLLVAVTGCASPKPVVVEVKEVKPVILSNEPSSELKAEFEAAMEVIKSEQFEKGIELLTSVASHSQQYAIPYLNLGLAYKKIGKLKEAEENLKLALNVAPENPVANNEYALLLRKTGRFTEARQRYEKILEKYPNFILAHKNLGILCDLYTKDYDCALKHYVFYSSVMQDDNTIKIWIADVQKRVRR
jgi:tetratricopeptide (TPR) repeat protein